MPPCLMSYGLLYDGTSLTAFCCSSSPISSPMTKVFKGLTKLWCDRIMKLIFLLRTIHDSCSPQDTTPCRCWRQPWISLDHLHGNQLVHPGSPVARPPLAVNPHSRHSLASAGIPTVEKLSAPEMENQFECSPLSPISSTCQNRNVGAFINPVVLRGFSAHIH